MKRFRVHRHPLLLTCVIVLFFVLLLNITTSFAQDTPFARLKIGYSSSPLLSLSPDGQTLATSGVGWWEVDLWDVATGKRLTTLNHPIIRPSDTNSGIRFISFISDSTLLSATDTSSICLWDVSETFSFGTLRERADIPGNRTTDFLLSPDGKTLAYNAHNDWREKSVYLWDISDGTLLKEFRNCSAGLSLVQDGQTFSFSRDSQTFLTDCETTVSVWDVSDGTLLQSFDRGETASEMSAISPDGQTLVINKTYRGPAPTPRIMELLDVSSGTLLKKFGIYYRYLTDISFSPDGQTLAVSSGGTVDLWDISMGRLRNTFKHSGRPLRIVFSPDGQTLLSGLSTVFGGVSGLGLWDVSTGRLRKIFQGSTDVRSISFIWDAQIPGGQILATAHKTRSGGLYSQNILEILLWRVGPAVPAVPEPVAAKSLLEEFIGLHKPFEAVARVAPPFDKLDDNDRVILLVNWEDIANDRESYEGNERLDVNRDGYVNKRDLQLVEFALTLDFDAICPTPAAKSLLEEFIGLEDPLAAVAGVVPPYDKLDDNDRVTLLVNWEDIANDRESYESNERLDVNQDGYVNKRDLQLVEFALTLDADSDGTLSGQEMASALSGKFPLTACRHPKVHVIWYYPQNEGKRGQELGIWRQVGYNYISPNNVETNLKEVEDFFVRELNSTFEFNRDSNGKIKVEDIQSTLTTITPNDPDADVLFAEIWKDIVGQNSNIQLSYNTSNDIYLVLVQSDYGSLSKKINDSGVPGAADTIGGRIAMVSLGPFKEPWNNEMIKLLIAHELGHNFGLFHDFAVEGRIMSYNFEEAGWSDWVPVLGIRHDKLLSNWLSERSKNWLKVHPAFNNSNSCNVDRPIEIKVQNQSTPLTSYGYFRPDNPPVNHISVSDSNGAYKIHLDIADLDGLHHVELIAPPLDDSKGCPISGCDPRNLSLARYLYANSSDPGVSSSFSPGDTTWSGTFDITKWMMQKEEDCFNAVIATVDQTGNRLGFQLSICEASAAPAPFAQKQLPKETALFVNYPNPFNPETWIPYQLANPTDVTLTIYDIQGRVVRDLDLGHQRAGIYHTRSRAAHWDGRNAVGEPVASGLYFYTLKAGEFTATRKMLIRK